MMSKMKTGDEQSDKDIAEAMQKVEEMMENMKKLEAMQKAAEK